MPIENAEIEKQEHGPKRKPGWLDWKFLLAIGVLAALCLALSLRKSHARSTRMEDSPLATVAAARVMREDLANELPLPAEFRPYLEVELHAKVSGFLNSISVDFGDKVKSNQLLATIEVPELQDQLRSALAMLQKAEVDYTNANLMYSRLQSVNQLHSNLVAQQELDTSLSKNYGSIAAIASATAEVERLQTLVNYTHITAPFDGVITRRYADPGALIQAGTASGNTVPLLRISDNYHLRLDFPVSVQYVRDIRPGQMVEVKVDSLGGRSFTGKITRFADDVNKETRTMNTEIEVENPSLEIVPGMYASVVLKVQERPQVLVIPTQAVGGSADATVYVINADHEIESRPVKLGLETPEKYEVASGLKDGELVMIGNRSLVHPGQKVDAKLITPPAM